MEKDKKEVPLEFDISGVCTIRFYWMNNMTSGTARESDPLPPTILTAYRCLEHNFQVTHRHKHTVSHVSRQLSWSVEFEVSYLSTCHAIY